MYGSVRESIEYRSDLVECRSEALISILLSSNM
jgi:hypothetical protein